MLIKSLVAVFLAAILTENYVLCKFLGICPFLGVSKKLNTAFGMSVAVTFVMVLATAHLSAADHHQLRRARRYDAGAPEGRFHHPL